MNSAREWILYASAATRAIVAGVIFVIGENSRKLAAQGVSEAHAIINRMLGV
jgi:hypothetical protein